MSEKKLHISLLQMDIAIGDPDANYRKLENMLHTAVSAEEKPDVIVCPEMWNTGYAYEHIRELADPNGERTKALISSFCKEHGVHVLAGSIADKKGDKVYNTSLAFNRDGKQTVEYSKIHLFRLMDEDKHLSAGQNIGCFEIDNVPAGTMICYDLRFPELARTLALHGVQIAFVPAEWPNPRLHHWRTLLTARAIENQMFVIACNRVGTSDGIEFFGHSMVIDPWGEILVEGGEEESILSATVRLDDVERVRRMIPIFEDRLPHLYHS